MVPAIIAYFPVISWVAAKPTDFQKRTRIKRTSEGNIEQIQFTFDCSNKAVGFYADVEYDCQIFHMCDAKGKRIPHVCANDTSFNQEFRICDWEYNFKCSDAPKW